MIVYQTDADGYLVGPVQADRSPLEPNVFLIPAGCVEEAPPAFDADISTARWDGGWQIVPRPVLPEPETPDNEAPPLSPLEYLSVLRRQVEEQGVVLPNGVVVKSDVESQGKIAQTIQSIDLGLIDEPVNWKAKGGFVPLFRPDLIIVGRAVAQHVQRSFNAEMAVMDQIEAGAVATHEEVEAAFTAALAPTAT